MIDVDTVFRHAAGRVRAEGCLDYAIDQRAVFASQTLTRDGFQEARNAYERFALTEGWQT